MKVRNLHDGSRFAPEGYSSWKDYWLKNQGKYDEMPCCPRCGKKMASDGSHVIKFKSLDKTWYIVPLCKSCNEKKDDEPFEVSRDMLVPANPQNL